MTEAAPAHRREATWLLRGTLTAVDGTPFGSGTVCLLPKESRGIHRLIHTGRFTAVTGDGSWRLSRRPRDGTWPSPAGCWVVAVKSGYRPVYFDGDTWDGTPIHLRARPGWHLAVHAQTVEGATPPAAWAQVWTPRDLVGESFEVPGPGTSIRVHEHGRLSSTGTLNLMIGTDGPVRVEVRCPGYYGEPENQNAGP